MQVDGLVQVETLATGVEIRKRINYFLDRVPPVGWVERQTRVERITTRRVTGAIRVQGAAIRIRRAAGAILVQDAAHVIELNEDVRVRLY